VGIPHGVDGHLPTAFVVCNNKTPESTLADFVNCMFKAYNYDDVKYTVQLKKIYPP
jgi:hypothetical protein